MKIFREEKVRLIEGIVGENTLLTKKSSLKPIIYEKIWKL